MKPKILCHAINVAFPDRKIDVILGTAMAEDYMKRFGKIPSITRFVDGECDGCFMFDELGHYLLLLPAEFNHHVVFHEALHAATRIWYDCGAQLEVPHNDEVLTYTMNYLVEQIEEIYNHAN